MTELSINSERLLDNLNQLRSFGAKDGGVVRPAFSEEDIKSRQWLASQMESIGLKVTIDPAGNVFGVPDNNEKPLLLGSHTDTQPQGGWLDGAYGVIAALEVAQASMEAGSSSVAVVSFQDEEGRFGPLLGSNLWCGGIDISDADNLADYSGLTFGEARRRICGLCQDAFIPPDRFSGFIEAHIEQGIVLDERKLSIGVVQSIVGIRTETFVFHGQQNHAGTTPMNLRRDAFQALVYFTDKLNKALSGVVSPTTVWTIGHVEVHPNASSIIPGEVKFTIQWRDGDDELLDRIRTIIHNLIDETADRYQITVKDTDFFEYPATQIDQALKAQLERSSRILAPDQWMEMPSGALHDASNVSRHLPVAMLFVPSINGISHNFDEDTEKRHLVLGAQVLAASISECN